MKKSIFILGIITFIISCKDATSEPVGNNIFFNKPQPINDSELSEFPTKFQGVFMNSDSTFLNIQKNIILKETYTSFSVSKNEMDSLKNYFEIIDNQYFEKSSKQLYSKRLLKDSIQLRTKLIDTFFIFSNIQKAKRINGNLVLNEQDSIFWKIKIISLNKNKLTLKHISSNSDLKKMDSITKIKSKKIDSTAFIINPSRREFSKFLAFKKFGYDKQFIKTIE